MNINMSEKASLKWMVNELKIGHLIPSEICRRLEEALYPAADPQLKTTLKNIVACVADIEPEATYTASTNASGEPEFTGYLLASGEPLSISGEVTLTGFGISYGRDGRYSVHCTKFMQNDIEYFPSDEPGMHLKPLWFDTSDTYIERADIKRSHARQRLTGTDKALVLLTLYYAKHSKEFRYGNHASAKKMAEHINELFHLYREELQFSSSGLLKINEVISNAMSELNIKDQPLDRLTKKHPAPCLSLAPSKK